MAWEAAVVAPRWNVRATMDLQIPVLDAQLLRVESSIESLDRKAALVLPAVGAIAALVGTDVNRGFRSSDCAAGRDEKVVLGDAVAGIGRRRGDAADFLTRAR
jgi:hypothetical protein